MERTTSRPEVHEPQEVRRELVILGTITGGFDVESEPPILNHRQMSPRIARHQVEVSSFWQWRCSNNPLNGWISGSKSTADEDSRVV